jgi:hypothetical protein
VLNEQNKGEMLIGLEVMVMSEEYVVTTQHTSQSVTMLARSLPLFHYLITRKDWRGK